MARMINMLRGLVEKSIQHARTDDWHNLKIELERNAKDQKYCYSSEEYLWQSHW